MATHSITRTALYARISTANNGQSPEMQLRELREYCGWRGWTVAGEYVDTGISGAKDRRPERDRLMSEAHKRRFDVVAVWKFDRFACSVSHLLRALDSFRVLKSSWRVSQNRSTRQRQRAGWFLLSWVQWLNWSNAKNSVPTCSLPSFFGASARTHGSHNAWGIGQRVFLFARRIPSLIRVCASFGPRTSRIRYTFALN